MDLVRLNIQLQDTSAVQAPVNQDNGTIAQTDASEEPSAVTHEGDELSSSVVHPILSTTESNSNK